MNHIFKATLLVKSAATPAKKIVQLTLAGLLGTLVLSACGKTIAPTFAELPKVQPYQAPDEVKDPNDGNTPDPDHPAANLGCEYWRGLPTGNSAMPTELTQFSSVFQIADDMQLVPATQKEAAKVMGIHRLAYLPQVLYLLSDEYAHDGGNARKKLDPITIEEFMAMVRESYSKGELSWIKKSVVEWNYSLGHTDWLIKTRNERTVSTFEASLPGIFTGNKGDLLGSQLIAELLQSANLTPAGVAANYPAFALLGRKTALFTGGNWNEVDADISTGLKVFAQLANKTDLPVSEKICRFAIKHRLTAQLVALKGVGGTPRIKQGLLAPLPTTDAAVFPTVTLTGAYPEPITAELLGAQLALPVPDIAPRLGGMQTEALLDFTRTFSDLQKTRSPVLWTSKQPTPVGQLQLDSAFLRLSLGLQVITLTELSAHTIHAADRITLNSDDTEDNLAKLGQAAMATLDSVVGLETPTSQDEELFSANQIAALVLTPDSMKVNMNKLMLGVGLEGLARVEEGRRSPQLIETLHQIGYRLGSKKMAEIR